MLHLYVLNKKMFLVKATTTMPLVMPLLHRTLRINGVNCLVGGKEGLLPVEVWDRAYPFIMPLFMLLHTFFFTYPLVDIFIHIFSCTLVLILSLSLLLPPSLFLPLPPTPPLTLISHIIPLSRILIPPFIHQ